MLRDITLGQYYPVDSLLHRLDPRTKLFGTLVYIVTLFIADNLWAYLAADDLSDHCHQALQCPGKIHGARLKIHHVPASPQRQL